MAGLSMMAFDFSHYQRQWEGLSHSFETHDTASARVARHLTEITDFGSNPGNLRMLVHVPAEIAPGPALVIALLDGLVGLGRSAGRSLPAPSTSAQRI